MWQQVHVTGPRSSCRQVGLRWPNAGAVKAGHIWLLRRTISGTIVLRDQKSMQKGAYDELVPVRLG